MTFGARVLAGVLRTWERSILMRRVSVGAVLLVVVVAVGSLTCSPDATGPDPNAVARVVITPDSGAIDTGDSLQFTAIARNSSGSPVSMAPLSGVMTTRATALGSGP